MLKRLIKDVFLRTQYSRTYLWMLLYRKNTPSKQLNNNGRADTYEQYLEHKFMVKYFFYL